MSKFRNPQISLPRACMAGRKRADFGGFSTAFLTLSVLLLVMALGFVFGRVVIARAYINATPAITKAQHGPEAAAHQESPPPVVYGQGGSSEQLPSRPGEMKPEDVPTDSTDATSTPSASTSNDTSKRTAGSTDVRYSVQVGLFSSEDSARDAQDQLTRAGYPARIEVERDASQANYRVLTGRYRSESNARKALDRIKDEGFAEAFVIAR